MKDMLREIGFSFVIAFDMLRIHKMRAFLTMLGVIIGVMSVSLIVLALSAFQSYIAGEFSRIGTGTIYVNYSTYKLEPGQGTGGIEGLKLEDIDYIQNRVPEIVLASGYREGGRHEVKAGEVRVKNVALKAIDQNFVELNTVELIEGRYISALDQAQKANVILISEEVRKDAFGGKSPLGKLITVGPLTLEVIGVTKNLDLMGERDPKVMFFPLATATSKWFNGDTVDLILLRAKEGTVTNDVMDKVWEALMVKSGNREVYVVESSENVLKIFQGILSSVGLIFSGIAALSLLVGGIGVMNIMLVSVTERTKEIGLRKAVGARQSAIMTQFLIESSVLTLVGGLIGMAIAWMLGNVLTLVTASLNWPREGGLVAPFPINAAVGALLFSAIIGAVFGFYPALKAAKLHPIEALRTE